MGLSWKSVDLIKIQEGTGLQIGELMIGTNLVMRSGVQSGQQVLREDWIKLWMVMPGGVSLEG